jgi:hypothetical protein
MCQAVATVAPEIRQNPLLVVGSKRETALKSQIESLFVFVQGLLESAPVMEEASQSGSVVNSPPIVLHVAPLFRLLKAIELISVRLLSAGIEPCIAGAKIPPDAVSNECPIEERSEIRCLPDETKCLRANALRWLFLLALQFVLQYPAFVGLSLLRSYPVEIG